MSVRISVARFLIRAGRFIQSLSVMVMRPRDLVEFNRRAYSSPQSVRGWSEDGLVDAGLSADEKSLLERVPFRQGRLLVLGAGGGREAAALAALGFEVTGVDFVAELAARAQENVRRRGRPIEVLVQDMSRLDVPAEAFDLVWLGSGNYSSVPTRKGRLEMLGRIRRALKPGGYFVCQFLFSEDKEFSPAVEVLRRVVSWLTLGNMAYEKGDRLAGSLEYAHYFANALGVGSEFEEAGFEIVSLTVPGEAARGGAVLRKVR